MQISQLTLHRATLSIIVFASACGMDRTQRPQVVALDVDRDVVGASLDTGPGDVAPSDAAGDPVSVDAPDASSLDVELDPESDADVSARCIGNNDELGYRARVVTSWPEVCRTGPSAPDGDVCIERCPGSIARAGTCWEAHRTDRLCDIVEPVRGLPPRATRLGTGSVEALEAVLGRELVTPVDTSDALADCALRTGCPTAAASVRTMRHTGLPVTTRDGGVVFSFEVPDGTYGTMSLSPRGDVRWLLWPFLQVVQIARVPDSDDVMVYGWGRDVACSEFRGALLRVTDDGDVVWTRPLFRPGDFYLDEARDAVVIGEFPVDEIGGQAGWRPTLYVDLATGRGECDHDRRMPQRRPLLFDGNAVLATETSVSEFVIQDERGRWVVPPDDAGRYTQATVRGQLAFPWFTGEIAVWRPTRMLLLDRVTRSFPDVADFRRVLSNEGIADRDLRGDERGEITSESRTSPIVDHAGRVWKRITDVTPTFLVLADAFTDEEAALFGRTPDFGTPAAVAQDGTLLATGGTIDPSVWPPRLLYSYRSAGDIAGVTPGGLVTVMSPGPEDTTVTWWQTAHGGLAHTPSPFVGFDLERTFVAPRAPFPTDPEIPRVWRWADEP